MSNALICLNAVSPVFLLMVVGYAARRIKVIELKDVPKFNTVAFKVFMPIMNFYNIYTSDISSAVQTDLIAFTVLSIFVVYGLCFLFSALYVKERNQIGVVIQGIYRSNFVVVGMPIAMSLSGSTDVGVVAVLTAIVIPIFNVLAVITLEGFNGKKINFSGLILRIIKNPLIIGSLSGIFVTALGIQLPGMVEKTMEKIARAASPITLFSLGAFFQPEKIKEKIKLVLVTCAGRLIFVPGIVLTVAALLGFRGIEFATLMGVFASSTATNSFTMAQQMGGDADLASGIVMTTNLLCSFTIFGWSLLFKHLGVF